jgi:hypothetical protein
MNEDEAYLRALAALTFRAENTLNADLYPLLLALVLRLRPLLATLPNASISRQLDYPRIRRTITTEIQTTSNAIFALVRPALNALEPQALELSANYFSATIPLQPRFSAELLQQTRIGPQSLLTLFTPTAATGLSPFTLQFLNLLERSLQPRFLTNTPTTEIIETLVPVRTRPRLIPIPAKGTILSSWRARVSAITAAAFWAIVYNTQQRAAAISPRRPTGWRWNAILDPKTCPICRPLHNTTAEAPWAFPEGPPPIHPQCRCVVLPTYTT